MASVTVSVEGLQQVVTIFERVAHAAANHHGILVVATTLIRAQALRRFGSKVDPDGVPWAPYAASTLAAGRGGNLLVKTGAMMGSISQSVSGNVGIVRCRISYARYHHTGTRKMPRRQFLGVGAADVAEIQNAVEGFFRAQIG